MVAIMAVYEVKAEQADKHWLLYIPAIDRWTQARNLGEVELMARDLIALWFEIDEDSFELNVNYELPKDIKRHLEKASKLREQATKANAQSANEVREAAKLMHGRGLTLREIGKLLGVSFQRAGQLVNS